MQILRKRRELKDGWQVILRPSRQRAGVPQDEVDALMAFYTATTGDSWTNNTGWGGTGFVGSWHGVTVAGGHVTQLSMSNNNLDGDAGTTLTGLDDLTILSLPNNSLLTGVDPTVNAALQYILLQNCDLPDIDISGLAAILNVIINSNSGLTTVTGSGNTLLKILQASNCDITTIDLTIYPALVDFWGSGNNFAAPVDTSSNPLLEDLVMASNAIPSHDLSSNFESENIQLQGNGMAEAGVDATIDFIYTNRASYTYTNPLLDISGTNAAPSATALEQIRLLTTDPAAEGFNLWTITPTATTTAFGVPAAEITALTTLYTDTAGASWTDNTNWNTGWVGDWFGVTVTAGRVTKISLPSNNLVGAADFAGLDLLRLLFCYDNAITALGISTNTAVTQVLCYDNLLTVLGVSANINLTHLYNHTNAIAVMDVSANIKLRTMLGYDNGMSQANIDSLLSGIYTARNNYTFAGPIVTDIGGTNASPSGSYIYDPAPGDGEEWRYALEKDDDSEGFTLWTIDIT